MDAIAVETNEAEPSALRGRKTAHTTSADTRYVRGNAVIDFGRVEDHYAKWPTPTCIIADGPYGVDGFPGDQRTPATLAEWYEPHVKAWSTRATPCTTLWFWNTKIGWATVHPLLLAHGWEYRCCNIWDKGLGHIAGNANTRTLRKFPVVTEVCVHYVKAAHFDVAGETLTMQQWLRHEWRRTGLPLRLANDACGVLNAATRKYLTRRPPLVLPATGDVRQAGGVRQRQRRGCRRPYFSVDGKAQLTVGQWARAAHQVPVRSRATNVWREPQVSAPSESKASDRA